MRVPPVVGQLRLNAFISAVVLSRATVIEPQTGKHILDIHAWKETRVTAVVQTFSLMHYMQNYTTTPVVPHDQGWDRRCESGSCMSCKILQWQSQHIRFFFQGSRAHVNEHVQDVQMVIVSRFSKNVFGGAV